MLVDQVFCGSLVTLLLCPRDFAGMQRRVSRNHAEHGSLPDTAQHETS